MATSSDEPLAVGRRLTENVLDQLKAAFVGKDEIIDLLGICLVARENLFLLGPPGTAKSALVQQLARRVDGKVFDYLLTRFTEPNELFGPFDIRRLREGELVTNTEGMLPEASLVFLDELLNANSAILNSLLMVLNERVFRRGRETKSLPTLMIVGASNRLPEDDALAALFDRFLVRVRCDNVEAEQLGAVLEAGWKLDVENGRPTAKVSIDELTRLQAQLPEVDLSPVRGTYIQLIHRLRHAGVQVSDRRAVKLQRLVAASALLCGRRHTDLSDLWVLRYIWDTEEQQEVLASLVQDVLQRAEAAGTTPDDDSPNAESRNITRHPRSRGGEPPDAERLHSDLKSIAARLDEQPPASERAFLRDRLGLLASRCQWVVDPHQRTYLEQQMSELWPRFEDSS